jgi:hypothetical protein
LASEFNNPGNTGINQIESTCIYISLDFANSFNVPIRIFISEVPSDNFGTPQKYPVIMNSDFLKCLNENVLLGTLFGSKRQARLE